MKRVLALLLTGILLTSALVGCDQPSNEPEEPTESRTEQQETQQPSPASDFEYKEEDGGIVITKYVGSGEHVVIPKTIDGKNVVAIEGAFSSSNIVSLVMPDTVLYVSWGAFNGCEKLTDIKMSESLITVGWGSFTNCRSLTDIDLSMDSLQYIEQEAFKGCQNLKTINFGNNIIRIRDRAFYDCTSREEIILPKNLQEIGECAFGNCSGVKRIWVTKTLEKWGYYPFFGIKTVTEIAFEDGLKSIGGVGESNVIFYEGKIQSLKIPASVEHISSSAFMDCMDLKEIYFEGAAPQIGSGEFLDFVTPIEDVTIYYDPSMPGWDTTPLREIYTLVPIS